MLRFADPAGAFYSSTAQALSGLYSTLSASIATSGLPSGNIGSTAFKNATNVTTQVPQTSGPYYYGMRFILPTTIGSGQNLFAFLDGSGNPQVTFQTNSNGTITAKRGTGSGTVLGTSSLSTVLISNVWAYVEFGMTCNGSTGTVNIRINGTSVLALTGQNTQGQSSTTIGACQILGAGGTNYVQDLYITDSTGSYNTGFLGDVHVSIYNAAGAGTPALNQYTANGAATVWQSVAAATPADGSIFASDATPSDRMSVAVATTSVSGTIAGIIHVSRVQKDASGTRTFAQTITSNGVDSIGATQSPGTSYAYYTQVSETDPNTGNPWTVAGFNQVQCGLETVS